MSGKESFDGKGERSAGAAGGGGDQAEGHAFAGHPPFVDEGDDGGGEGDEAEAVEKALSMARVSLMWAGVERRKCGGEKQNIRGNKLGDCGGEGGKQEGGDAGQPAGVDLHFPIPRVAFRKGGGEGSKEVGDALGDGADQGDVLVVGELGQGGVVGLEDAEAGGEAWREVDRRESVDEVEAESCPGRQVGSRSHSVLTP